jgi:hypothetical protein
MLPYGTPLARYIQRVSLASKLTPDFLNPASEPDALVQGIF